MEQESPGPLAEQMNILDVLRALPDRIEGDPADIDRVIIQVGGSGIFPVRVWKRSTGDYEGYTVVAE